MAYDDGDYDYTLRDEGSEDWVHVDDLEFVDIAKEYLKKFLNDVYVTGDMKSAEKNLAVAVEAMGMELPDDLANSKLFKVQSIEEIVSEFKSRK